ncbi:undecaprenyl-phosphate glucose phosphotransferase [candidate division KSB1 bacterium]|nr:undecaprenyl-phosphate glucose phosphotransferase [candidate division KSB1 bacterium]
MLKQHRTLFSALFIAFDFLILNLAFLLAYQIRFLGRSIIVDQIYFQLLLVSNLTWLIGISAFSLYGERRTERLFAEIYPVLKTIFVVFVLIFSFITLYKAHYYSRLFLGYFLILITVLLILSRVTTWAVFRWLRKRGRNTRNLLIVGAGRAGEKLLDLIEDNPGYGYRMAYYLDDRPGEGLLARLKKLKDLKVGKVKELEGILANNPMSKMGDIEEVLIALPLSNGKVINSLISTCDYYGIKPKVIPDFFWSLPQKISLDSFADVPVISLREFPLDYAHNRLLKRCFDILVSSLILLFYPIIYAIIGTAIKLSSRGPVYFKQERTGLNNRNFDFYKFRSMQQHSPEIANTLQATKDDPRITAVGRFLRKTNLDEIPQIINVFKGNMSLVGPRPHMLKHTDQYQKLVPKYMVRHLIKPGMTGWAQVNGYRGETKRVELMKRRVEYDLYYIENWSFWFDIKILFLTLWVVLKGQEMAY